jgi:Tfp pilus assembly protein PilV
MNTRRHASRRPGQLGLTLIEMMVAILASVIVVLSLSRMAVSNQRMISGGFDQAYLQQEMARLLERVTRDVHVAHAVAVSGATEFRTFNASGAVLHTYRSNTADGSTRFQRDGVALTDRNCGALNVTSNADSTTLDIDLTLVDAEGNESSGFTQVCVRNRALEF